MIDAEAEYEGQYAAAQTYINDLRAKIGAAYPLALASFPYVSYHPSFPYSVFLGPGGAQYNAPQMYWKDIGTRSTPSTPTPTSATASTARPIFPLGQTYGGVVARRPAALPRGGRRTTARPAVVLGLAGDDRRAAGARSPRRWRR